MRHLPPHGLGTVLLPLLAAAALVGCKKDDVQTYQAPKDAPAPAAPQAPAQSATIGESHGSAPAGNSQIEHAPGTPWKVPQGWAAQDASGMRIASYGVKTADGRAVDISVVPLSGDQGPELDNVNRWRGQAQLSPLTEAELPGTRSAVAIGNRTGTLYQFAGDKPSIDNKYKVGMLVAVLPAGEITVYFKMTGESELVTAEKPHFLEWLKSVQTEAPASDPGQTASAPAPAAGGSATPPDMQGQVVAPPRTDIPAWEPPAHWKAMGQRPMRLASFEVPNAGGGTPGDLSISALSGAAGGLEANVNRWRGQAGLEALDEAGIAKSAEKVDLGNGATGTLVDLRGPAKRILAVIVPQGDRTWFYKLTADDALITKEREGFIKFVKSVKY